MTTLFAKLGIARSKRDFTSRCELRRKLRYERYEDRRMLTTYTVNVDFDVTSWVDTDSEVSLREAIERSNAVSSSDIINFSTDPSDGLDGATINLSGSGLFVSQSVTIDASMLSEGITINGPGNDESVLAFSPSYGATSFDVTLKNLTITGGEGASGGGIDYQNAIGGSLAIEDSRIVDNAANEGAGIRLEVVGTASSPNIVRIERSEISGNQSSGKGGGFFILSHGAKLDFSETDISNNSNYSGGGGISATLYQSSGNPSSLSIAQSIISDNESTQSGGGINVFLYDSSSFELKDSTISGNEAISQSSLDHGGGGAFIFLGYGSTNTATIDRTTFFNNTTSNGGGGFFAYSRSPSNTLLLSNSTLTGNHAQNNEGGGAYVCSKGGGTFKAVNSTISANDALGEENGKGGGLFISRVPHENDPAIFSYLDHLTITENMATSGGGLFSNNDQNGNNDELVQTHLNNSIISGNFDASSNADNLGGDLESSSYNLWGPGVALSGTGDQSNSSNDPEVGPLQFNGGSTMTHALLPGSPAIDMGDSTAVAGQGNIPEYDQRGEGFDRVFGGRIDIGAFEVGIARIVDVEIDGTSWTRAPFSFAELVPTGQQLRPIATQNVNTIRVHFSDAMKKKIGGTVSAIQQTDGDDLLKLHQTTRNSNGTVVNDDSVSSTSFSYDTNTNVGTWTFNNLPDGKYAIHIFAGTETINGFVGPDDVPLDAQWINEPGETTKGGTTMPSWDDYTDDPTGREFVTTSGSNEFRFHFAILVGDYNGDGVVNEEDETDIDDLYTDGNGDGEINSSDEGLGTANSRLPLLEIGGADFFNDEAIDGQDLQIWQNGFGGATVGDADGDGDADGVDFLFWQYMLGSYTAWGDEPVAQVSQFSYAAYMADQLGIDIEDLTYGLPPQVVDVIVGGSLSAHDPYSYDTEGADGSGDQLVTVPVALADTISITFSEDVTVPMSSLVVVGLTTGVVPYLAEFSYDAQTYTASWRFEGWALGDTYLLYLMDDITDADGNYLDGEWTNPQSMTTVNGAISTFPSGDGTGGGTFNFAMTLLPGDANLDGVVDSDDQTILSSYIGTGTLFIHGDFNGSGSVNWQDAFYLGYTWGVNLQEIFVLADLDSDGDVDGADLAIIGDNFGMTGADWEDGDLNGDGTIDDYDLDLAFAQYGLWLDWVA